MASIPLDSDEASVLANLLGAPQLVAQLREEHRDLPGISTRQLPIGENSPWDGRTLGETAMRTRTGVSVVAVMRADRWRRHRIPTSPSPRATSWSR